MESPEASLDCVKLLPKRLDILGSGGQIEEHVRARQRGRVNGSEACKQLQLSEASKARGIFLLGGIVHQPLDQVVGLLVARLILRLETLLHYRY